jgi:hypothetical protein
MASFLKINIDVGNVKCYFCCCFLVKKREKVFSLVMVSMTVACVTSKVFGDGTFCSCQLLSSETVLFGEVDHCNKLEQAISSQLPAGQ